MKIVFNNDKELVADIQKKLRENDGYCPCRTMKTPETKCMCKEFKEMIFNNKPGECHCGLYVSVSD